MCTKRLVSLLKKCTRVFTLLRRTCVPSATSTLDHHLPTLSCSYHHTIPGTHRIPDMCVRLSPLHRCDAPIKVHSHALVTSSADSPILMSRCRRCRCRDGLVTNLALGQYCCRHACIPDAALCCCCVVASVMHIRTATRKGCAFMLLAPTYSPPSSATPKNQLPSQSTSLQFTRGAS